MEVLSGSGARVWIEDHPTEGWAPGRVDSVGANGKYIVVDDQGSKFEVQQENARPVDPNCLKGVDDLLSLGDFNEGALLHNVRCRYFNDSIYTGIGSPILISVNPFQNLAGLYSEAKQKFYREQSAAAGSGEDANLPPHLFSVAAASYSAMLNDARNQSIIISGESGAGKTEATKKILMYFANLQRISGHETEKTSIEDQVLKSNPILEAFGNAKTIRNDNSSRFGKFIDIEFDPSGKLTSARISNYLLEKSRIVKQQPDERGYHVFYQICAGASMLPELGPSLGLQSASEHAYSSVCTEIPGVDDAEMLQEALECMESLGFSAEERRSVFQLVAAVLLLGDMSFQEGSDGSLIGDGALADKICELLQVSRADFTRTFQYKTLEDPFNQQIINMQQDPAGSSNTRHSMAKHLYSRLFDWLVWRINQSTASKDTGKKDVMKKIGILDIYGFEVFDWNSFEQLCINFANEKLQQHFNSHMFTMEQRLYTEEGISWSHIEWQDNREIIDSLEKKPFGLFNILDSECSMPKATDDTCLSKIHSTFKSSKVVYKTSRFKSTNFAVAHYAGEVVYDVLSFLEKNTDKLHADIINLLKSSSMPIARTLFSDPRFAPDTQAVRSGGSPPPRRGADASQRAKQNITVSMMFRQQLDRLVEDLNRTNPRYIRCIKPNGKKQAHEMDSLDVQRQLRCAGMLESIRIRRAGYPVRRPFKEFFNRFRILCPHVSTGRSLDPDYKDLSKRVLTDIEAKLQGLEPKSWQIGRSKVFLKEEVQAKLEKAIGEAVKVFVLRIQKRWRGFRAKRRYRAMKQATLQVQAVLRTVRSVVEFRKNLLHGKACVSLQATLRMLSQRLQFLKRKSAIIKMQTLCRGWLCRRKIGKLKGKLAADRIQKMREEEEKKQALDEARRSAQERARALSDMQKQLVAEREKSEREAAEREEQQLKRQEEMRSKELSTSQEEKLRQDLLDLRKENARLQGQLDSQPQADTNFTSADLEAIRLELQEVRREKVRLEVELATSKTAEEYASVSEEAMRLREECSKLKGSKMSVELQLEQRSVQLASAEEKNHKLETECLEVQVLKSANDDLQIQLQRLEAQKQSLEQRAQLEAGLRNELRDLKLEKIHLEGELDTAKLREEAITAKLKGSEKSTEVQQLRARASAAEAELEQSQRQVKILQEDLAQQRGSMGSERANSLDSLRTELLSRIESRSAASASNRPSIMLNEDGRKSLLNQRELFEKLKQQFDEATAIDKEVEPEIMLGNERELELEEELRRARTEQVELNIKLKSVQEEFEDKCQEAKQLLASSSNLKAEVEDLKLQLEQESASSRKQAAKMNEFQALLLNAETDLPALRKRASIAEEQLVKAQEEVNTAQQRCMRAEEDKELLQRQVRQLEDTASAAAQRERESLDELRGYKDQLEAAQEASLAAERSKTQSESSHRFLQTECERLKGELVHANSERAKMRQMVDEVLKKYQDSEIDEWKRKAQSLEKELQQSKQLAKEMNQAMSLMTQQVSGRGDASSQAKVLQKQLETKTQELKTAKREKDEVQKELDEKNSAGDYFKDKFRGAQDEIRKLNQENSHLTATNEKLKRRLESASQEDMIAPLASSPEKYSAPMEELQERISCQAIELRQKDFELKKTTEDLDRAQVIAGRMHLVNECLNTLLALENEQTGLYEKMCAMNGVKDNDILSQLSEKKEKTTWMLGKLQEAQNDLVALKK